MTAKIAKRPFKFVYQTPAISPKAIAKNIKVI
jgi:hypothetical protein